MGAVPQAPELGPDHVVRFQGPAHFLDEFGRNLVRGQLNVTARDTFSPGMKLPIRIEGPGVPWQVRSLATVMRVEEGLTTLRLEEFDSEVFPTLDLLAEEVERRQRRSSQPGPTGVREEKTQIGAPSLPDAPVRAALPREAETPLASHPGPPRPSMPAPRPSMPAPRPSMPAPRPSLPAPRGSIPTPLDEGQTFEDLEREEPTQNVSLDDLRARAPASEPPAKPRVLGAVQTRSPPSESPRPLPLVSGTAGRGPISPAPMYPAVTAERPASTHPPEVRGPAAVGMADLAQFEFGVPRVTAGGVMRIRSPADLLGLYLSQIRHGLLHVLGGPEGGLGSEIQLKVAGPRVVVIPSRILARCGEWLTLGINHPQLVVDLLRDTAADWSDSLADLGPVTAGGMTSLAAPPLSPLEAAAELVVVPSQPPRPTINSEPPPPPKPSEPASGSDTPEPPVLVGNQVRFRRRPDLRHELTNNLKNGGLFVNSPPIGIRERRSLTVEVANMPTGVTIEADVVFAADGKVGFSVQSFAEVTQALERFLETGASVPPPSVPPEKQEPEPEETPFEGLISPDMDLGAMLDFPRYRAKGPEDLKQVPVFTVLDWIARDKKRGVLTLLHGEHSITLHMHEGSVAFVRAEPWSEEHSLGRILVASKKITEPQLREALEKAQKSRKSLGRVLVSQRQLASTTLAAALREQTRLKLEQAFGWTSGRFKWTGWTEPPTHADLVLTSSSGILARHLKNRLERTTSSEMDHMMSLVLNRILVRDAADVEPVLGLTQKEIRFYEVNLEERPLAEAITGSPLGRLASMRLVAFGLAMGLLRVKGTRADRNSSSVRASPRLEVTDGKGYTMLRKQLQEDVALLRDQNYFDVIGVHWSAHQRAYRTAYEACRGRYRLERDPLKSAPEDVKDLAKEAIRLIDRAFDMLSKKEERARYRQRLFDDTERKYAADMLVKQGEVLILRGDRMGSLEAFETAVELSPTQRNKEILQRAREGSLP